jgi:general stress protein 26
MQPSIHSNSSDHKASEKHTSYVIEVAKKLADGDRPGVLATVDEKGMPHLRWMATLSLREFPLLYTLTSPVSRKVGHIKKNPGVSWMFSNVELNLIVNIRGNARIVDEPAKMQKVWKMVEDKSKAYFLNLTSEGTGYAVIETEIEDIDCVVPKYDLKFETNCADLSVSSRPPGE